MPSLEPRRNRSRNRRRVIVVVVDRNPTNRAGWFDRQPLLQTFGMKAMQTRQLLSLSSSSLYTTRLFREPCTIFQTNHALPTTIIIIVSITTGRQPARGIPPSLVSQYGIPIVALEASPNLSVDPFGHRRRIRGISQDYQPQGTQFETINESFETRP